MEKKGIEFAFIVNGNGVCESALTLKDALAARENGAVKIGEVASREFPTISPDATLEQCLPLISEGDMPVAALDKRRRLVGVITRAALLKAVQSNGDNSGEPNVTKRQG
jgi:CBS domain-containing protein